MLLSTLKRFWPLLVSILVAFLIAGKALYPGYILLLDLGWTPTFPLEWSKDGFNNTYPIYAIIHLLTLVVPSWVVQKLFLLAMLVLLLYIPFRYLPYITNTYARIFAVLVFALNPFVYARILSGQWFHVVGYALLPLLLYALVQLVKDPGSRRALARLVIALLGIGMFSVHFLYLAIIITIIWLAKHIVWSIVWSKVKGLEVNTDMVEGQKSSSHQVNRNSKKLLIASIATFFFFALFSTYWLVPAYMRDTPLESRFDVAHYIAFASAANRDIPVMQNVLALGGFWGEGYAWRYFFVFPQETVYFWIAFLCIFFFILIGIRTLIKNSTTRYGALILVGIGVAAYITSLGAAVTPFRGLNLFLYEHIPFWDGMRDSNKIVGVLALVYAVFAGIGVQALLEWSKVLQVIRSSGQKPKALASASTLDHRPDRPSTIVGTFVDESLPIVLLLIPMIYGLYMWGGLHNQLQPVAYPQEWNEMSEVLKTLPEGKRVLVLPWHSYLSLPFVGNRLVASPIQSYFGKDKVIVGRDVGIGGIHDQEVDEEYRAIDTIVLNAYQIEARELVETLQAYNIVGIMIIRNPLIPREEEGLTKWTEFSVDSTATSTEELDKSWLEILPKDIPRKLFGESLILLTI